MSVELLKGPAGIVQAAELGHYVHPQDRRAWVLRKVEGWGERVEGGPRHYLTERELEDLDELLRQDRMLSRYHVRQDQAEAVEWGDYAGAVRLAGYQGALPSSWAPERSRAGSGLVSVLTTQNRSSPAPFATQAAGQVMRSNVGAFPIDDTGARRLSSLRMQVGVAARLQCADLDQATHETLMVTLTYRGGNESWAPNHMRSFMDHVRKWCKRQGLACDYVWVAELQKRGVIHYHVALWVPKGTKLPKPDQCGWWPHGMTRIEVARAAVPYLLKYLSKGTQSDLGRFPRGARIYGMGGLDHQARRTRRWLRLPAFVQARSDIRDDWRRAVGGGWTAPDGTHYPSEFQMTRVAGKRCLVRVHRHESDWRPDGPFSWLRGAA